MKFQASLFLATALLVQATSAFVVPTTTTASVVTSSSSRTTPLFEKPAGHDVQGNGNMPDLPPGEMDRLKAQAAKFMEHQQGSPEMGWPEQIRTLVQYNHGYAVISTKSKENEGYPSGSVVGFVPDKDGNPLFLFSGMSTHTQDILVDPKASLTVASKEFKGAADGRVNLMGTTSKLKKDEIDLAKELYLAKHPNSKVWINFGDFTWFRLTVEKIRFVGGFARAGSVTAEEYHGAAPDAISQFGGPVANHMNQDHGSSTLAMVKDIPGLDDITMTEAEIVSLDSLGMYVKITREPGLSFQPEQFKMRLPFPRPATDRADVKTIIVEMTQAAAKQAS